MPRIPPAARELRLARNQLSNLGDLRHLTALDNLSIVTFHNNPFCHGHYLEFAVYTLPGVDLLDGERITDSQRAEAVQRFSRIEQSTLEHTLAQTHSQSAAMEETIANLSSLLNNRSNDLERALEELQRARQQLRDAGVKGAEQESLLQLKDSEL